MPLPAEFLANDPVNPRVSTAGTIYGKRWALALGVTLLIAFALVTFLRWAGEDSPAVEQVVQQPITADGMINSPRADLTAPDPGDTSP